MPLCYLALLAAAWVAFAKLADRLNRATVYRDAVSSDWLAEHYRTSGRPR